MIPHAMLLLALSTSLRTSETGGHAVMVHATAGGWVIERRAVEAPWDAYEASLPPPSPWCWVPRFGVPPPPERRALVRARHIGAARDQQPERGRLAYRVSERMRRPIA